MLVVEMDKKYQNRESAGDTGLQRETKWIKMRMNKQEDGNQMKERASSQTP